MNAGGVVTRGSRSEVAVAGRVMRRVDRCIYCGTSDGPLGTEHIVPYGLAGEWLLDRASCTPCSAVTSKAELDVLRNMLGSARITLRFPSRRKRQRKSTVPLLVTRDGREAEVDLPPEKSWPVMTFPVFAVPAEYDRSRDYSHGIGPILGIRVITLGDRDPGQIRESHSAEAIEARVAFQPVAFALVLAKIAYGWCVATYGLDAIETVHVLPAILGQRDDIGRWVGNPSRTMLDGEKGLHVMECGVYPNGQLAARVRLFAHFQAPEYFVIVGQMTESWRS